MEGKLIFDRCSNCCITLNEIKKIVLKNEFYQTECFWYEEYIY